MTHLSSQTEIRIDYILVSQKHNTMSDMCDTVVSLLLLCLSRIPVYTRDPVNNTKPGTFRAFSYTYLFMMKLAE